MLCQNPVAYTDRKRLMRENQHSIREETDIVQDARQIITPGVQGERTSRLDIYSSNRSLLTVKS